MLPGLSESELRRLLLSVGTHRGRGQRPLTPVEVADHFAAAIKAGASLSACAEQTQLQGPDMVRRFLRLLDLAPQVTHLVDFGESGSGFIGFSGAFELAKLPVEHHEEMGMAMVEHELTKKEAASIRQLLERSSDPLPRCIERVVKRRPVVRHLEVILGAISRPDLQVFLGSCSQRQRNELLRSTLQELAPGVDVGSARLGAERFSLVGPGGLAAELDRLGDPEKEIEEGIRSRADL